MSQLAQAGASNTVPLPEAIRNATLVASSIDPASRTGTWSSNTERTSLAEAPIATTPARREATDPRGVRWTPLASPPAIRTPPSAAPTAAIAACGFVAFELSTKRTPSTVATGSPRWGSGENVPIASLIAWSPIANAWAAVAAAAASARIAGVSSESAPRSSPLHPAARRPSRTPAPSPAAPPPVERNNPRLRRRVGVERAVPIQVVRRQVQQHGDSRVKRRLRRELEGGDL